MAEAGGESLRRVPVRRGDVPAGDRVAAAPGKAREADLVVRWNRQSLPLFPLPQRIDPLRRFRSLTVGPPPWSAPVQPPGDRPETERGSHPAGPAPPGLRARQLDSSHVFHPNGPAIRRLAHDDVAELFRRSQAALRQHRVSKLLVAGSGLAAHLAGRIHGVLRLDGVGHLRDRDAELRQLVGLHPEPHRVLSRAEYLHLPDAGQARDGIVQMDVGIVRQELRVVRAVRRI